MVWNVYYHNINKNKIEIKKASEKIAVFSRGFYTTYYTSPTVVCQVFTHLLY